MVAAMTAIVVHELGGVDALRLEDAPEPEVGPGQVGMTAVYLRLTPRALYNQRYRGEEPGAIGIRVGRRILYRPSDIDHFLVRRLTESRSYLSAYE
jgi:hypothetical protein